MFLELAPTSCDTVILQVGQTAEALNAARAEVAQAEKDAAALKKRADDLTVAAGKKSAEADEYRDKWEKLKQEVSVAKNREREHWERAKQVSIHFCVFDKCTEAAANFCQLDQIPLALCMTCTLLTASD